MICLECQNHVDECTCGDNGYLDQGDFLSLLQDFTSQYDSQTQVLVWGPMGQVDGPMALADARDFAQNRYDWFDFNNCGLSLEM